MTTTCPPPLWPSTDAAAVCGGGSCLDETHCACPAGWTGRGDLQSGAPSCAMYVPAVQGLWGVTLVAHVLSQVFSLYCFKVKFLSTEARAKYTSQRKAGIRGTRAAAAVVVIGVLVNACFIVTAALRVSDPVNRTIGTDPALTFFFCLGSGLFWTAAPLFLYQFLNVSLRQAAMKKEAIRARSERMFQVLRFTLPALWVVSTVASAAPLFMLGRGDASVADREAMFAVATTHYVGIGVSIIATPLYLLPKFVRPMTKEIQELVQSKPGFDTSQLEAVVHKLKIYMRESTNQGITNLVACIVFGVFPYCSNWSSYWLALAWLSAVPILVAVLYLIAVPAKSATSAGHAGSSSVHAANNTTGTADSTRQHPSALRSPTSAAGVLVAQASAGSSVMEG